MALGVDTVFALAVLELKKEGFDIKLCCAIPCLNHSSKWPKQSQDQYNEILKQADFIKIVTEKPYSKELMQIRNEYMVNYAEIIYAVWDGSTGGTKNCIEYAKSQNKNIINFLENCH